MTFMASIWGTINNVSAEMDLYYSSHNATQRIGQRSIEELRQCSTLSGRLKEMARRFLLAPDHLVQIWVAVSAVIVWEELLFFFSLGFLLPLACRKGQSQTIPPCTETSIGHWIANNVAQMGRLFCAVHLLDIVLVVLESLGWIFARGELQHACETILCIAWVLHRASAVKRFVLAKQTKCDPENLRGQVQLVDRMVDAFLYCMGLYVTIDLVKEDMGAAAKGFLALGSIGTMIIGLASQGLAAQLFNGLFLASSNRIAVGDFVRFSNGVRGVVIKLGWVETMIRTPDEHFMTIPNKDLADQRVTNLSRVKQSAVKQTLRFKYKDIEKLPAVLETIMAEVKRQCPDVIADGSRPFRAFLTGYHADHIAATLDFRFRLPPLSDRFYRNRQNVILIISKVVKDHGVEFAVADVAALSTAVAALTGNMK